MIIADAGAVIEDASIRGEFEFIARDMATEMTPAQLKAALAGLVQRLDPEGCEKRVRDAVARRKVTARETHPTHPHHKTTRHRPIHPHPAHQP